ncbi:hypothetical protein AAT19DRAFT_16472, partial [Rhodotorula toruloides]
EEDRVGLAFSNRRYLDSPRPLLALSSATGEDLVVWQSFFRPRCLEIATPGTCPRAASRKVPTSGHTHLFLPLALHTAHRTPHSHSQTLTNNAHDALAPPHLDRPHARRHPCLPPLRLARRFLGPSPARHGLSSPEEGVLPVAVRQERRGSQAGSVVLAVSWPCLPPKSLAAFLRRRRTDAVVPFTASSPPTRWATSGPSSASSEPSASAWATITTGLTGSTATSSTEQLSSRSRTGALLSYHHPVISTLSTS